MQNCEIKKSKLTKSHNYEFSWNYEIKCQTYDILIQFYENKSKNYEFNFILWNIF